MMNATRSGDVLTECLLVLILTVIGTICVFSLVEASLAITNVYHSPTIQDPYERQSEAK